MAWQLRHLYFNNLNQNWSHSLHPNKPSSNGQVTIKSGSGYKIKLRNVKLQAKIKNSKDKARHILPGHVLIFGGSLHCQKAQQAPHVGGRPLKQGPHSLQKLQVQTHRQNQGNHQGRKLLLLCYGKCLNQPHRTHQAWHREEGHTQNCQTTCWTSIGTSLR